MKIAGTVILYNPDESIYKNIESYIYGIDVLIIVDNSEDINESLINKLNQNFSNIIYKKNKKNLGIAKALNIACNEALERKCDWLLTMDQDSFFNNFNSYKEFLYSKYYYSHMVAIIAPVWHNVDKMNSSQKIEEKEVSIVITSGNFLNLSLFNNIGGFNEKLFIDEVDHDYCLSARSLNYKIIELNGVVLNHSLGDTINGIGQHNYIRRYYITRNSLYMWKKYRKVSKRYSFFATFKALKKSIKKVIKLEENKLLKIKSIILGIFDFLRNKYGKRDF